MTAELGQQGDIDDLDVGAIGIDDDPTDRRVVDDHDLLLGSRMIEADRHRLGAELHANQTVEHFGPSGRKSSRVDAYKCCSKCGVGGE